MLWFNTVFVFAAFLVALGLVISSFLAGEMDKYMFMAVIVFFAFAAAYAGYVYAML